MDQGGELSFLSMLLHYKGTVLILIWPQLLLTIIVNFICSLYLSVSGKEQIDLPADFEDIHKLTGSMVAFLLVFRTNLAYERYFQGHKLTGQILNATREMTSQVRCFFHVHRRAALILLFKNASDTILR